MNLSIIGKSWICECIHIKIFNLHTKFNLTNIVYGCMITILILSKCSSYNYNLSLSYDRKSHRPD